MRPWQHQALTAEHPRRRDLPTLAGPLGRAGYHTRAYVPRFLHRSLGAEFDQVGRPVSGQAAVDAVAGLADETFVWFHLPEAEIARGRWQRGAGGLRLARHQLLAYADPAADLPDAERDELWRSYGRGVRRLDGLLGEMLDALAASAAWERSWVVVTGAYGSELGEHGQILSGENLGRESIEVPLLVWMPAHLGPVAEPAGGRVAQTRIWSTISGAAGHEIAPLHPPSLFRGAGTGPGSSSPILSELYAKNGVNRFALLDGDLQLHWPTRFGPAEPEYYRARRVQAGARAQLLREPARRIFARLDEAFRETLPLSGPPGTEPQLELERWTPQGVEGVRDPAAAREMALSLRRHWMRFVDRERPPAEETVP